MRYPLIPRYQISYDMLGGNRLDTAAGALFSPLIISSSLISGFFCSETSEGSDKYSLPLLWGIGAAILVVIATYVLIDASGWSMDHTVMVHPLVSDHLV